MTMSAVITLVIAHNQFFLTVGQWNKIISWFIFHAPCVAAPISQCSSVHMKYELPIVVVTLNICVCQCGVSTRPAPSVVLCEVKKYAF